MLALGIESSANKLGIGLIRDDGTILANVRRTYSAPDGEGFLPRHVARHHRENMASLIREALEEANLTLFDISLICYTMGPGIGSALHIGCLAAKTLHILTGKPIIGVNHCVAHVEMGRFLSGYHRPCILYVSGGNTQVLCYDDRRRVYAVLGETLDIAIGNVFDRLARVLKLANRPSPGHSIELMARKGKELIQLPFLVKGMDCSLSGLLTRVEQVVGGMAGEDVCFSVQEYAFAMLVEMAERAMALVETDELLLVGGVGCNLRLQQMAHEMATARGAKLFPMDERYCIDNGAMIALTGLTDWLYGRKQAASLSLAQAEISQKYRTDQAPVWWIE